MAKQIKLSAQTRTQIGRSAVKKIKAEGFVPGVVYGSRQQPQPVQLLARDISNVLSHATGEHLLVQLEISGEGEAGNRLVLIQEVQHHPVRGHVLHVDFHAISADEKIHAQIPIQIVGEAPGVKNSGGILESPMHALAVECLPKDLPDAIIVDVSSLKVGESLHVRDLLLPEGVTTAVDADLNVVRVAAPAVQEAETPGATAATPATQPEVIKEKKAEEGEKK